MNEVSVLITTHNGGLTLPRAVKSALDQDGVKEVCICDDASTNDTIAVINSLGEKYPGRIRFIGHIKNSGTAEGYNSAASMATGDYFIILGDDDYFEPNCLKRLAYTTDMNDCDFGYGRTQHFGMRNHLHTPPSYNEDDFWKGYISLYGVMYRRGAWDAGMRYQDLITLDSGRKLGACDYDFTLQMIDAGYKGLCLPDVTVLNYCYMPKQSQTANVDANQAELVRLFKERWSKWQGEML